MQMLVENFNVQVLIFITILINGIDNSNCKDYKQKISHKYYKSEKMFAKTIDKHFRLIYILDKHTFEGGSYG